MASRAIIITGMHRSGTSMVASMLRTAGVAIGGELYGADPANPKGYFEDVDFLELDRTMLKAAVPPGKLGWPDWGWVESEEFDRGALEPFRERARLLVAERQGADAVWGWKDPRTSLLLEFWDPIVPDARYLFVYRYPWDVSDSIRRLNADIFNDNPSFALKIWEYYNRALLEFARRNRDRCIVLSTNAVMRDHSRFSAIAREKLGLDLVGSKANDVVDKEEFGELDSSGLLRRTGGLISAASIDLLAQLDEIADIASPESEIEPHALPRPDKPKVSVVVPCYNDGRFILEAVGSFEACGDQRAELLIVNDGSTEPLTLNVLNFLRRRAYSVISQENRGLSAARNAGIKAALGDYLLPLDSDNRIRPEYISRGIDVLDQEPDVGMVYGNAMLFGGLSGRWSLPPFEIKRILVENMIDACAVIRRTMWEQCGGYDESMRLGYEDWDFWLSAIEKGWRFVKVDEVLFDYRYRCDSMVRRFKNVDEHMVAYSYMVKKHADLYSRFSIQSLTCLVEMYSRLKFEHENIGSSANELRSRITNLEGELDRAKEQNEAVRQEFERRCRSAEEQRLLISAELDRAKAQNETVRQELDFALCQGDELKRSLEAYRSYLADLRASKFWKLRAAWFRLRRALGLKTEIGDLS